MDLTGLRAQHTTYAVKGPPTTIRFTPEAQACIEQVQEALDKKAGCPLHPTTHVVHLLLLRGYAALKEELGLEDLP